MVAAARLTPWSCPAEWLAVRQLVTARDPRALAHLEVWGSRVARLPAGVETTVGLLRALLATPHTTLSLATAVNRFLNHISHLGMALWDVSRLGEACARLAVPEWLVELRHETTHGAMPPLALLRAALHLGLAWLDQHYWAREDREEQEEEGEDRLARLLEVYKYLKVYQVWGTATLQEIREQGEVWELVEGLWGELAMAQALATLTVKQAVGLVKTEVVNLVREEEEEGLERLAMVLVEEELLLPGREFLDSLEEEEGGRGEVKVPRQLQKVWGEMVGMVDRGPGAAALVDRLMARAGGEGEGALLAGAWVVLLVEGMLGRGGKLITITPGRVGEARLERWLERPSPVVVQLVALLCQVAGVEEARAKRLENLVKLAANPPEVRTAGVVVKRLEEVLGEKVEKVEKVEERRDEGGWELDTQHSWESVVLGGWEGQGWEDLWVVGEWEKEEQGEEEEVPEVHIGAIDWSTANGQKRREGSKGAHFYTDSVKSPRPWKRQRKA